MEDFNIKLVIQFIYIPIFIRNNKIANSLKNKNKVHKGPQDLWYY